MAGEHGSDETKARWKPETPEFARDSVAVKPEYQLHIPNDHRILRRKVAPNGVIDRTVLDAITETTGVAVALGDDGLPTRESLDALVETGMTGCTLATRLLAEIGMEATGEMREKLETLGDELDKAVQNKDEKMYADIDKERLDVYAKLWPYDHLGNATGQQIAAWMRKRADYLDIVVDGKLAKGKFRGIVERYGERDILDLDQMLASATEDEFTEICPNISRQEVSRILHDPHIRRLLDVMQPYSYDRKDARGLTIYPDQVKEFLQLEHYAASLPHSVGGLKELLVAHARAVHAQVASHADYHADLREAFEQATENTSDFPTYEQYWEEQDRKQKTPLKRLMRALEKLLGITD